MGLVESRLLSVPWSVVFIRRWRIADCGLPHLDDNGNTNRTKETRMTSAELTYGEPKAVATWLWTSSKVTKDDLHSALCNAMDRIDRLEGAVKGLGTSLDLLSKSLIHEKEKETGPIYVDHT
jgi:hypothetical protein